MKRIETHLLGIAFYGVWVIGLDFIFLGERFRLPLILNMLFRECWVFYTGYLFLRLLFRKNNRGRWLALPLLLFSLLGVFCFNLVYKWTKDTFYEPLNTSLSELTYDVLMFYTQFFIYSIGYFFFTGYVAKQKKIREMEAEQHRLKETLLQTENNFLRAQINPHFLYNSLNNIYAKTFDQNPQVAEAIMHLSQVMRYSIQDFSKSGGMASLKDEVEHIRNVIAINKFRFGDQMFVNFNVTGDIEDKLVTPLLLITIVENVFKHGNLSDLNQPAKIYLTVSEVSRTIVFYTLNKIGNGPVEYSTGLGLSNVRQRLQACHGTAGTLKTEKGTELFKVKLEMPYTIQPKLKRLVDDKVYAC